MSQKGFEKAAASHNSKELSRRSQDGHRVVVEMLKPGYDVGKRGGAFERVWRSTG
jgi:hypothetical protein